MAATGALIRHTYAGSPGGERTAVEILALNFAGVLRIKALWLELLRVIDWWGGGAGVSGKCTQAAKSSAPRGQSRLSGRQKYHS
jgi:hypothetical protein